jgi:hypothetical protein
VTILSNGRIAAGAARRISYQQADSREGALRYGGVGSQIEIFKTFILSVIFNSQS